MFTDLKRCVRCHQRYPEPLGHFCPLAALSSGRAQEFEQAFRAWLGSNEGRFAEYLAQRQRTVLNERLPAMDRFVLAARLRPDGRERAESLLAEHSAFGAEQLEAAFDRHAIFLSEAEVIFLFEGEGAHEAVRALFNDPARSALISHWLPLVEGPLHRAAEAYLWERR